MSRNVWFYGPILFVLLYITHSVDRKPRHDGSGVYGSCRPADVVSFSTKLTRLVDETPGWMKSNESRPFVVYEAALAAATTDHVCYCQSTRLQSIGDAFVIWASLSKPTQSCSLTFNEQYRDASLHSVNYARFRRLLPPATIQSPVVAVVSIKSGIRKRCLPAYI